MEQSIYANNKGKCINAQKTEQVTLYLDFSTQLTVNGFGPLGHPAQKLVEQELEPDPKMVAMVHCMLGCHAAVVEQRQNPVKACLISIKN